MADWEALPEDTDQRWELLEGVLVSVPTPTFRHNRAGRWLANMLEGQAGSAFAVGTANRLVDGRYAAAEPVRGEWRTDTPFPVTIDLPALI